MGAPFPCRIVQRGYRGARTGIGRARCDWQEKIWIQGMFSLPIFSNFAPKAGTPSDSERVMGCRGRSKPAEEEDTAEERMPAMDRGGEAGRSHP